jgi:hypothetical protein
MTEPRRGAVAAAVAAEVRGLSLWWVSLAARAGPSPPALRERLRTLSNRDRGADAVVLRTRPVPRAYRAFVRQIGIDPDVQRIPAERVAVARLMHGGLPSDERIADACTVAIVETGVGVWALDGAVVAPEGLEIGIVGDPSGLPGQIAPADPAAPIQPGTLVVRDRARIHAPLFGDPLPGSTPGLRTISVILFALGVPGVPEIHLHEALWQATEALARSRG